LHGKQNDTQHKGIAWELRVQTCVQSLSFDERHEMRKRAAETRSGIDILRVYCPWLLDLDTERNK